MDLPFWLGTKCIRSGKGLCNYQTNFIYRDAHQAASNDPEDGGELNAEIRKQVKRTADAVPNSGTLTAHHFTANTWAIILPLNLFVLQDLLITGQLTQKATRQKKYRNRYLVKYGRFI